MYIYINNMFIGILMQFFRVLGNGIGIVIKGSFTRNKRNRAAHVRPRSIILAGFCRPGSNG